MSSATHLPVGDLRVVIVAESASQQHGGEASLPLHWFRRLRNRGIEAWLVTHERSRDELRQALPGEVDRMHFTPDTLLHRVLWGVGRVLPDKVALHTLGIVMSLATGWLARRTVRRLVAQHQVHVVHEPTRVSPKTPSLMHSVGAPVVMGPLNGGMSYPPAFAHMASRFEHVFMRVGRAGAFLANTLLRGKRRAATILVANERTRKALPTGISGRIMTMIENGVDRQVWKPSPARPLDGPVRMVFLGQLVAFKCIDLLLRAFAPLVTSSDATLDIIGDGPERPRLEAMHTELGLGDRVRFRGYLLHDQASQIMRESDVLVFPSMRDCGGAVMLEALASGVCVVAAAWGGALDYVDSTCGILLEPHAPERFVPELHATLARLASSKQTCRELGRGGPARIATLGVEWNDKIERMLEVYRESVKRGSRHV